jgi:hypothetical protein
MSATRVEYVGFTTKGKVREYTLRVKQAAGEFCDFTLSIPNEAFLGHLLRYQDAPDICFLKLQKELAAIEGTMPASCLKVSDADLAEYRTAHAPTPPRRRPRPPIPQ